MRKIPNQELNRLTPEEYGDSDKLDVVVVLDNVRSAGNVGAFFRTCDAFGIKELLLCGISATPPSKEIHKTALGAEFTVPWQYFEEVSEAVKILGQDDYTIVAIEQAEGAIFLEKFNFDPGIKYALVFGNEVDGVSQSIMNFADYAIEIPQIGTKHSLNVAVSGGAVLWEAFRQLHIF